MIDIALQVSRGSFHIDVACQLAAEWTVIFGPSGAGKSTILRLLAGLDRSGETSARLVFNDRLLTDTEKSLWIEPGRRDTAFVVQQAALFPHLNVEQNVAFGLAHLERAARELRVGEMLELVGAVELSKRRVQDLSGGQAQRVSLARALATHPKLLLLDEPFSALDGAGSDEMLNRLRDWVRRQGVQVVLATHDVADALTIGAEVLQLREGRQVALGPAIEVLAPERNRLLGKLEQS